MAWLAGATALAPAVLPGRAAGISKVFETQAALSLPAPRLEGPLSVEGALLARRSIRDFRAGPLALEEAAQLLWATQGITAALPGGLRTAPSAGALYPLEVALVAGAVSGLAPGVYRYLPRRHALRPVCEGDLRAGLAAAALGQSWIAEAACALVLAAVYRRTTRKYGPRGERYVHIEVGHVGQNVYLQARALGLGTTMVGAFRDAEVRRLLDLEADEAPLAILPVGRLDRAEGE
jgi:SagB-type dehydrogenase family enzyme